MRAERHVGLHAKCPLLMFNFKQYFNVSTNFRKTLEHHRLINRRSYGRSAFDSPKEQETLLYSTASRPALKPIQPPMQWVPEVKRPGREADH
jgi:hypothetical protein